MPRWLQSVLYPSWFMLVFVISVYLTFPLEQVKTLVEETVETAVLGKGSPAAVGRHGVDPELKLGKLTPWRLSGATAQRVYLRLASSNPDPGAEIDLDEVSLRIGLLSLLTDELQISFDARLYGGRATGDVHLSKEDVFGGKMSAASLRSLDVDLQGVKLDGVKPLIAKVGVPVTGTVDGVVSLQLGPEPNKDGEGEIDLKASRLTLGPGDLKVFGPITTDIPLIDLGVLSAKMDIKEGQGKSEVVKLDGRDANAELDVEIGLQKRITMSTLSGDGSFQVAEPFLKDNPKFQGALGFLPGAAQAKDDQNRYHFQLLGTLQNVRPALSKDAGKSRGKGARASARRGRR